MTSGSAPVSGLVEHFFRHESGRLTATLLRKFGAHRLDDIEDAIQFALERALGVWPRRGVPDAPAAWLTQVAKNRLIDRLRLEQREAPLDVDDDDDAAAADGGVLAPAASHDDLLTLLFACADDRLAPRARLVLCLKLVCGFSTEEIAVRLFMTSANVQKTLERGRQRLQDNYARVARSSSTSQTSAAQRAQLSTVQHVLYLVFNEGYSLGEGDIGLRVELCDEAIRLTGLLAQNTIGDVSSTWALLALMHFHAMRLPARLDADGRFIPLDEQDRQLWDQHHRRLAFTCIAESSRDDHFSRFHGEAAIQVEHAMASSTSTTRWTEIVPLYEALERMAPSPLYTLNRAIAQAEATHPQDGLDILTSTTFPGWFRDHHLLQATLGDLHRRQGAFDDAITHFEQALQTAPSTAEQAFLRRRIAECRQQKTAP